MGAGFRVAGVSVLGWGFEVPAEKGGCQNYGPILGTLNIRCRITIRTQKGTLIFHPYDLRGLGFRPKPGLGHDLELLVLGFRGLGFRGLGVECLFPKGPMYRYRRM